MKTNSFNHLVGFRVLGILAALAGLTLFWACHLNNSDSETRFDVEADSSWAACDSLTVILENEDGDTLDILFNDSLVSLDQLKGLSAAEYPGGKAQVHIIGHDVGGGLCVEQTRSFDDDGGPVVVDTVALPGFKPASVSIDPSSLELAVDDPSVVVVASIKPSFADQVFEWSVEDASIATLDFPNGPNAGRVVVIPQKNGTVRILARAKQDTSKSAELIVSVGSVSGKTISLSPDSLKLYLGGPDSALAAKVSPDSADAEIAWSSQDEKIAKVDAKGVVTAVGEGSTRIKAKFGDAVATAEVRVKRDVPVLTVASKKGAGVNVPIVFSPKATQEFGSIVLFEWDLNGDGEWDDSLPGPFLGTSVDLPAQTVKYPKEGEVEAGFLVRDSEGNEAGVTVHLNIGNQPPEILAISRDTVISIRDSVPLRARVRDAEGKVAWIGWDFEADHGFDDTLATDDSVVDFKSGHRYPDPGRFAAVLRAVDDNGKVRIDSVVIRVEVDPPVADAGHDTTVIAGTPVNFHAGGMDSLGAIAKRELKIGDESFINLGKRDTTLKLSGDTGQVICVVRVTDDDDNTDEDTMVVTLVAPDKSNNQLAGLVASAGTLSPVFKPVTIIYSLAVAYADSQVTLTPTTFDPEATLAVNGKPSATGTPSDPVAVKVGTTVDVFKIVVTAQDGNQRVYSVSVTRAPSADASLSKLEPSGFSLKPDFAPVTLAYADTVAFSLTSVTLKATPGHPAAKITVNDTAVESGSDSPALPLVVGDNLIKVTVTAQDGKTKSTYSLKVVRRAKLILTRLVGDASPALTDSLEYPMGTTVSIQSPDSAGFHFLKWVVTSGSASLDDSTANPANLTLKSATVRMLGIQVINTYSIKTSISGFVGGAFSPTPISIQHGKDTTVTITPLVGYRLLALTDNGKAASTLGAAGGFGARTYKLSNVTEDHALEATFLKTYTLTSSVSGNGSISPVGAVEVDSGSSKVYTMNSGSPSTGVIVSSLMDNGKEQVGAVTGDPMNTSKYTLAKISANHTIVAGFTVKTFTMKVYGSDLCVRQVVSCPVGQICPIRFCLSGSGPDSTTVTANYGSTWNISTADSIGNRRFLNWNKDGVNVATTTGITTPAITANTTYNAVYLNIIIRCCPGACCVIGGPVVTDPIPTSPSSSEPLPQTLAPPQEN